MANAGLIKKVYFTRAVLPASSVLSWNTNLLIELGVLSVALLFVGQLGLPLPACGVDCDSPADVLRAGHRAVPWGP